jgi:hypothetical protein
MRDETNRVRRMPRSSAEMVVEQCRHLCATAASGQLYLADVTAGRAVEERGRVAAAQAATARLQSCVCPS